MQMQDQESSEMATENEAQKNEQDTTAASIDAGPAMETKEAEMTSAATKTEEGEKPIQDSDVQMLESEVTKSESTQQNNQRDQDGTYIASDLSSISHMIDQKQMMCGFKPVEQIQADMIAANPDGKEPEQPPRMITLPDRLFADFKIVDDSNEKLFEFVSYSMMIQVLEELDNDNWALEFPACIGSAGRSLLHEVGNYFGLAHHSQGKAGKNRRTIIYPRSQFKEKQEAERRRLEKEKEKIKEKIGGKPIIGTPIDNPKTFREQMIKQVYEEQRGHPVTTVLTTNMVNEESPVPLNKEEYLAFITPLVQAKKKELETHEYTEYVKNLGVSKEELLTSGQAKEEGEEEEKKEAPKKKKKKKKKTTENADDADTGEAPAETMTRPVVQTSDSSKFNVVHTALDDDEPPLPWQGHEKVMMRNLDGEPVEDAQDDSHFDLLMTPAEKAEEIARAAEKQKQADQIAEYQEKLKTTTLANFEDRPDPIEEVRVVKNADNFIVIEWDKPCENNQPIFNYNIYLSEESTFKQETAIWDSIDPDEIPDEDAESIPNRRIVQQYTMLNLDPNTSYYIKVRAENQLGVGYVAKYAQIVTTLDSSMHTLKSLYVWGSNSSSEIGLTDDIVNENKESYLKCNMMKPVKHPMFNGLLYDVVPGNVNTMFHCINAEDHSSFLVTCGMTNMLCEGNDPIHRNEVLKHELMKFEDVASIPYSVDFDIPVVKVVCGDLFIGILTAEGSVWTQGYNTYGQLGIKNEKTMYVQRPQQLKFEDKDQEAGTPVYIKDLACGFNHCVALTEKSKVFVWGRRMGIYLHVTLDYHWLKSNRQHLELELNICAPRMLKDSLIFYHVEKLRAGLYNAALITREKQVLLFGDNAYGQLGLGEEKGKMTPFFPNFLKHDFFMDNKLDVLDITFTAASSHFLCRDKVTCKRRVFCVGNNQFGQLGNESILQSHTPLEITERFDDEVMQISSGGYHTLALTASNNVYGWGKMSHGQLGKKWVKGEQKFTNVPTPIEMPSKGKIEKVACGSLYSTVMVSGE